MSSNAVCKWAIFWERMSENLSTPTRVKEKLTSLEKTLEEIDAPVESGLEIDCHYLPFKGHPKKVIIRLNSHKDPPKLFLNK